MANGLLSPRDITMFSLIMVTDARENGYRSIFGVRNQENRPSLGTMERKIEEPGARCASALEVLREEKEWNIGRSYV